MPKSQSPVDKPHGRTVFKACLVIATAIAVLCAFAWATFRPSRNDGEAEASTPKFSADSSPEKQRARNEHIDRLISSGVFHKVDRPVKRPHVYVSDRWDRLNDADKRKALGVVLAYYHVKDPEADMVIVRDAVTGKRIGIFSKHGLELD